MLEDPFLKELAAGSLPLEKFCYYLQQDDLYLGAYGRALAFMASRATNTTQQAVFLMSAKGAMIDEKDTVHKHYLHGICPPPRAGQTPALFAYSNALLASASYASIATAYAATRPCSWVYAYVGKELLKRVGSTNPYYAWVKAYAEGCDVGILSGAKLLDELLDHGSPEDKVEAQRYFDATCELERRFWQDAYELKDGASD